MGIFGSKEMGSISENPDSSTLTPSELQMKGASPAPDVRDLLAEMNATLDQIRNALFVLRPNLVTNVYLKVALTLLARDSSSSPEAIASEAKRITMIFLREAE